MSQILARPNRPVFLSPNVISRIKILASEAFGFCLFVLGIFLLLSILSYNQLDPSLNTSSKNTAENLMGPLGAYIADLLTQTLGLTAVFTPILLFCWSWRLILKRGISIIWARLLSLIAALIFLAISLSFFNATQNLPSNPGLGGFSGMILFKFLTNQLAHYQFGYEALIVAISSFLFGISCLVFATSLNKSEWAALWLPVNWLFHRSCRILRPIKRFASSRNDRVEPKLSSDINTKSEEAFEEIDIDHSQHVGEIKIKSKLLGRKNIVAEKTKSAQKNRHTNKPKQELLALAKDGAYLLPPLDFLENPPESASVLDNDKISLSQNAQVLETVLEDFGIKGEIVKVRPGPVVTLYELEPAPGTKTSRVVGLADDIARSMSVLSVRIAVVPGRSVIGIELPNLRRDTVYFRELLATKDFQKSSGTLTLVLGKDIGGKPRMVDLARMPHLLIAGTTGSGKSVAINTMICSLLYRLPPDQCKFIMIDPKMLELSVYDGIPNLLTPVVTESSKAVFALKWAVREMEDRYKLMSQLGVRNITGYNNRLSESQKKKEILTRRIQTGFDESGKPIFEDQPLCMDPLPLIVVVVDEMADLMMVAGKDIEAAIQRLAQMARAAGIHLIMATQRPSVDVITGTIKANFPTRISFQVTSKIDSRTILGDQGAEQLLGQGDMLYMAGGGQITRVHGPFVKDEEVEQIVNFLKRQGSPDYVDDVTEDVDGGFAPQSAERTSDADNQYYDEAVSLVAREGKASTSFIQRHLQIGYNRAARIMEQMEEHGVVTKADRVGRRQVLIGDQ